MELCCSRMIMRLGYELIPETSCCRTEDRTPTYQARSRKGTISVYQKIVDHVCLRD